MNTSESPLRLRTPSHRWVGTLCFLTFILCTGRVPAKDELFSRPEKWPSINMTLTGFNYTDQGIGYFGVNGAGGDTMGAFGGSGEICCVGFNRPPPWLFHVRWAADICQFTTEPNMYGNTFEAYHYFYKEADVKFSGPSPKNPGYVVAHFYPDGHVEVDVSEGFPSPRLQLNSGRERPMRRCTAEELK